MEFYVSSDGVGRKAFAESSKMYRSAVSKSGIIAHFRRRFDLDGDLVFRARHEDFPALAHVAQEAGVKLYQMGSE